MDDPLKQPFPVVLDRIKKQIQKSVKNVLREYGLSGAHGMYLFTLYQKGPLTMKELSQYTGTDKANTTRVIADLHDKGFIYDDRPEKYSRKYKVYLTKQGNTAAQAVEQAMKEFRETMFRCLSEEEKEQLSSILRKIVDHMEH